ncbi:ribonuclease P protein subunit p20 [Lucilia sericata]|uniref:ribonuclease P protein subunit p20 n=1 Tax=Lucilia sericata TaxID=13632 RepID=UPI0018A82F01|nr:ribonuclease P protein subunit p20 [Lucilia sericata]XP_037808351.1 ribonuclease P protein subunit p20 [Lucilia sericata]
MEQHSANQKIRSQSMKKANYNRNQKKKTPPKVNKRQNDIYITTKSNFKAQQKHCEDLLNAGIKEIYLHCLGNAILRGLNLASSLVKDSNDALTYAINTSTIHLIDEYHPLSDADDISIQRRNNSAVHIKIVRNSVYDVDVAFSI